MLPPMRPSPITPICIRASPESPVLATRQFHCTNQLRQTRLNVLEMNAQRTPSALVKNVEISLGLRGLDHAKSIRMTGDVDVSRIIARDLQKHAGIRTTLVSLTSRMLEARTKTKAGSCLRSIANSHTQFRQCSRVRNVAFNIG